MLSVDEVWSLIDREVRPLPPVRVPLGRSLGRRLAGKILADADMPAFCRSAIDGYALPEGVRAGLVSCHRRNQARDAAILRSGSGRGSEDLHGIRASRIVALA